MASESRARWIKLASAIALFGVAGVIYYTNAHQPPLLPTEVNFVCVATGEMFRIDREKVTIIPAQNPKSGEFTLLPCVRREDGVYVDQHYAPSIKRFAETNKHVDAKTLRVQDGT